MKKYILVDNKMRDIYKKYFESIGYFVIEVPRNYNTYEEISSHVDIFFTKIRKNIIVDYYMYFHYITNEKYRKLFTSNIFLVGNKTVRSKYPYDIYYNLCIIGNNAIHNFKYTDKKILEILDKENFNKINVSQGYTKCSIAVIDDNSCITCDKFIADKLIENNIDVLYIEDKLDIKLLRENKYSKMNGFIGGSIVRVENKIIVFGDLSYIDKNNKIRDYITLKGIEIVDFKGLDVIDYGSVVSFEGEKING